MASSVKISNANGKIVTIENNDSNMSDVTLNGASITKKVDTLANMRAMGELPETVWCSGYHSENDGAFGSHFFRLKGLKTTETDNGGTVIVASVGGSDYVYELQYDGAVNVKWFGAVGEGPTDDTVAIQSFFDFLTGPDGINGYGAIGYIPQGNYRILATLKCPSLTRITGSGRWSANIFADASFVGTELLEDKGSASKLYIEHLKFDASLANTTITSVIKLGYTIPFGTEGRIGDILIKGGVELGTVLSGYGLNIIGNVGLIENVSVEFCATPFFEGPNSVLNSYYGVISIGSTVRGMSLNTSAKVVNAHIEAPSATCVPLYVSRSASFQNISVSLANVTIPTILELDSNCIGFDVKGLSIIRNSATSTHILTDNRSISSTNPYWADGVSPQGTMYNFGDTKYIRVGTSGYIGLDVNNSLQIVSEANKGSVYTELVHFNTDGVTKISTRLAQGLKSFYPDPDNTVDLGFASRRWKTLYAATGTINTSDDREKTYLDINESEKLVAKELKDLMKKFKFNDSIEEKGINKARIHYGTSAQGVISVFKKHGLNAMDYAIICYDEWDEEVDEDGNITLEAGDRYGIRYEELLCFIISAL